MFCLGITAVLLLAANGLSAQSISEGFEESQWSTVGNGAAINPTQITVSTTNAATATTNLGSLSIGAGNSWTYSGISRETAAASVHSGSSALIFGGFQSMLITPVLYGGVATITFWANTNGAGSPVFIGIKTNFTSFPMFPTAQNPSAAVTSQFSINTSVVNVTNGVGAMVSYGYTYTAGGTTATGPVEIVLSTGAGATLFLDDLSIVAPTCTNPYTWTGVVDSNWSVPGNWTCGILPGPTNHVIIPAVTRLPVLTQNVTIDSCSLNNLATITLNGWTFTNNGEAIGTGKYIGTYKSGMAFGPSTTGTIYFTAAGDTLGTVTLADGAKDTIASTLMIASTGTVSVGTATGATLYSNGNITLVSDNNGSARIGAVPVSSGTSLSNIVGIVNVQCYIHSNKSSVTVARRAWRLLTAPVSNFGLATATTIYNSWQDSGISSVTKPGIGTLITEPPAVIAGSGGSAVNGMDPGINNNYSCYTWSYSSSPQKLVKVTDTKAATSTLSGSNTSLASAANIGYFIFIRGDRTQSLVSYPNGSNQNNTTLSAAGILQLGTQTFSSGATTLAANSGILLVGNPYACSVNFKYLAGDTASGGYTSGLTNLINRFYFWNSNLTGSQGVGNYQCVDDAANTHSYTENITNTAGVVDTTVGVSAANYNDLQIQSGQAFFVMAKTTAAVSIAFTENDKTATGNNFIYRPQVQQNVVAAPVEGISATLALLNSDNTTSLTDGVVAQFNPAYSDTVDYLDAPKFGTVDESFSLTRNGQSLCIERRGEPDQQPTDTLFLSLKQMAQRGYQFKFNGHIPNHPGLGAHLEDAYSGTHTPLNLNGPSTVNFTIDTAIASQAEDRFMIVFGAVNELPVYTGIKATKVANTVLVQWNVSNDQSMNGYEVQKSTDGGASYTTVYTTAAAHTTGTYSWSDTNPVIGRNYYRIISIDALNEQSYSPVVYADIAGLSASGIIVYPNPIQNGQIGLALNSMPAGEYKYRLLNELGQDLQNGTVNHAGGNATDIISLSKSIPKGTYQLEIFEPDNSRVVISVLY